MARSDPQVNVRIPADMKTRLDQAASASGRSFTAEVVHRLEQSFVYDEVHPDIVVGLLGKVRSLNTAIRVFRDEVTRVSESKKRSAAAEQDLANYASHIDAYELDRRRLLDTIHKINPAMSPHDHYEIDPELLGKLLEFLKVKR